MRRCVTTIIVSAMFLFLLGCEDQAKKDQTALDKVKQTVIPNCDGRTMNDLAAGLLQNPVWGLEKKNEVAMAATLSGTIMGDALPEWMKEQKMMDITFRLPFDATGSFDPKSLEGFPSLTSPEGVLQAYRLVICQ